MRKSIHSKEYRIFLELLWELREESGVTQVELAKRLRTTQSFVSKCERGERRLDVVEARAWCQALRVSFAEFASRFEAAMGKS